MIHVSEDRRRFRVLSERDELQQARPHIQERVEEETVFPGCRTPIPVWVVPLVTARCHKNGNPSARLGRAAWRSSIFLLLRPHTNFA
jgi:hypothetical protein